MDSVLLGGLQFTLDAESNYWLQDPFLPQSWFQLDVGSSVYPVPTGMEDVQVTPGYEQSDLDLVDAPFASTSEASVCPQPTAASGLVDLEGASSQDSSSPSSTSSFSDLVSMAINQVGILEDFQMFESEDSSSCSPAQSVAEDNAEDHAASGIVITPPQLLVLNAGFDVKFEPGKNTKHAP